MTAQAISAELLAVVVALVDGRPSVLTLGETPRLPAGPLLPSHRSLQAATRAWVEQQSGQKLGYLEQLYTFADLDRAEPGRRISVSYLGLTRGPATGIGSWTPWYELLPWEDLRTAPLPGQIWPALREWAGDDAGRKLRCEVCFGPTTAASQALTQARPDAALQRYELLYEVGLVPESPDQWRLPELVPGQRMFGDHRRILATALARLRAKIEYRPVVFELLPDVFTLRQLQDCVEALAGRAVHTQNFRRLVAAEELVEDTGEIRADTGGRPARVYRFKRDVVASRQVAGTRLPLSGRHS
ncbi:MAG: hypothetical protein LBR58_01600 [Propionibacteriaceae bacterium]|jgi:hypothetical protein|nr:hypothetical protein [Propionibacteriaceae bacterium]